MLVNSGADCSDLHEDYVLHVVPCEQYDLNVRLAMDYLGPPHSAVRARGHTNAFGLPL